MFGMQIPAFMLKQFYRKGSLRNVPGAVEFALTNPVMPATIVEIHEVSVGGMPCALSRISFAQAGPKRPASTVSAEDPIAFQKGSVVAVTVEGDNLAAGSHALVVKVSTEEFGMLKVEIQDEVAS